MRAFGGGWEFAVYRRCEWVYEVRPMWTPNPKRTATELAETTFTRALPDLASGRVSQPGVINADVLFALDLECAVVPTEIDCIATATGCFSADRAVAKIKRIRM